MEKKFKDISPEQFDEMEAIFDEYGLDSDEMDNYLNNLGYEIKYKWFRDRSTMPIFREAEDIIKEHGEDSDELRDYLEGHRFKRHCLYHRQSINYIRSSELKDDYIHGMTEYILNAGIGYELLERFMLSASLAWGHKIDREKPDRYIYKYLYQAKGYEDTIEYFYDYYLRTIISIYGRNVRRLYDDLQSGMPVSEAIEKHIIVLDNQIYQKPLVVI